MSLNDKPTFYYMLESPPCRTVIAVARLLGIELELKRLDLSKKEQLNPEFVKINPFHTVPTLVDVDGFTVWESRAIATYLIQSQKPSSFLYPVDDLKRRTTIDKFLHFDLGTLYRSISDVVYGLFFVGKLNLEKIPRLQEHLTTLNDFFVQNNGPFIAGGDQLSVADISLFFSLTLLDFVEQINLPTNYPAISAWNEETGAALKVINDDGKFDEARENMKIFVKSMVEKGGLSAAEGADSAGAATK